MSIITLPPNTLNNSQENGNERGSSRQCRAVQVILHWDQMVCKGFSNTYILRLVKSRKYDILVRMAGSDSYFSGE